MKRNLKLSPRPGTFEQVVDFIFAPDKKKNQGAQETHVNKERNEAFAL